MPSATRMPAVMLRLTIARPEAVGSSEAERDDRQGDRFQREPDTAEPAQCADLDEVVEPEGQDGAAGGSRATGGEATRPVGTRACRKQLLPTERAQDEAGEVQAACKHD